MGLRVGRRTPPSMTPRLQHGVLIVYPIDCDEEVIVLGKEMLVY